MPAGCGGIVKVAGTKSPNPRPDRETYEPTDGMNVLSAVEAAFISPPKPKADPMSFEIIEPSIHCATARANAAPVAKMLLLVIVAGSIATMARLTVTPTRPAPMYSAILTGVTCAPKKDGFRLRRGS